MKHLILALFVVALIACAGTPKTQVIEDPLSPDGFTNFLIFDGDGHTDVLLEDPILQDGENYILFRESRCEDCP